MDALTAETVIDGFLRATLALGMFFIPLLGLTALYEWVARNRPSWLAAPKPPTPRSDARIPADERALLGDDWRDAVAAYFVPTNNTRSDNDDAE